jgi:DNA-binding IclR family transcriptional regulator
VKRRPDTHIIQSLDKGLLLLETVETSPSPVSLTDLAQKLGWDKATIHRLLLTLERRGYLLRNQDTKRYGLGLKIFGLYDSLIKDFDIQQATRPFMLKVAELTGETTHLAVAVGREIVFIDRIASTETLFVNTQIGAREPLHCTALGRAILAFTPEKQLRQLLPARLTQYTPRTITLIAELRKVLHKVRDQGFALDMEEYVLGIHCVAAPILDHEGTPIAALGISGPRARIPLRKAFGCGALLREAANEISRRAGWRENQRLNPSTRQR